MKLIISILLCLTPQLALAGMPVLRLSPACIPVTTALFTGLGTISIKVPGTFSGPMDNVNIRYLKQVDVYADTPADGDFVDGVQLSDDDGVIPVPARGAFPSYPVLLDFSTDTMIGTSSKAGFYFDNAGETHIQTFDGSPQPLPSGLYLKATINNAGLLSKTYRVNVVWGKPI